MCFSLTLSGEQINKRKRKRREIIQSRNSQNESTEPIIEDYDENDIESIDEDDEKDIKPIIGDYGIDIEPNYDNDMELIHENEVNVTKPMYEDDENHIEQIDVDDEKNKETNYEDIEKDTKFTMDYEINIEPNVEDYGNYIEPDYGDENGYIHIENFKRPLQGREEEPGQKDEKTRASEGEGNDTMSNNTFEVEGVAKMYERCVQEQEFAEIHSTISRNEETLSEMVDEARESIVDTKEISEATVAVAVSGDMDDADTFAAMEEASEETEPGDTEEVSSKASQCQVCQRHRKTGSHYGALSCYSCRAFFR